MSKNKKDAVIEFIKDIEDRELRKNSNQRLKVRNTVLTQLQKFMDRKQYIDNTYIALNNSLKTTIEFCKKEHRYHFYNSGQRQYNSHIE